MEAVRLLFWCNGALQATHNVIAELKQDTFNFVRTGALTTALKEVEESLPGINLHLSHLISALRLQSVQ